MIFLYTLLFGMDILPQEWHPNFYRPPQEGQTSQMMHALKELPKLSLHGNEAVLDIGCGNGAITHYIAEHLVPQGSVHGIDISQPMIDSARAMHRHGNLSFKRASLFDEPMQLYDIAVCFWVLYLFDDYADALKSALAYLKPGGRALICHIIDPGTPFFQLFKNQIQPVPMPVQLPRLETIIAATNRVSASLEYLEIKYNYDRYTSLDELYATMKRIPFFTLLSQEKEERFYHELQAIYRQQADGYVYDYSQIVCMVLKNE